MSVKIDAQNDNVTLRGLNKDLYGLPVQDDTPRKEQVKGQPHINRSRTLIGGIRVPNLRDLDSKYVGKTKPTSCRFDIVERVETIIKPGSYGPSEPRQGMAAIKFENSKDHSLQKMSVSRQPTFHASPNRSSNELYAVDKLGPYHWNQWVKLGRNKDARDVLYRNTYCMEKDELRYRSLTLPRISPDKTYTIETAKDANKSITEKSEGDSDHVIIAKQPRGTVVRFREYMRPATYGGEGHSLEIKRFKTQINQIQHYTAIRNAFPMIHQDSHQNSRRSERPLKFENSRYTAKSSKGTLFNKHIYPAYKNAFNRDYSSADTFREYLESLQSNGVIKPNYDVTSRENTRYELPRSADYENQVLHSVQEVNQPNVEEEKEEPTKVEETNGQPKDSRSQITVEIKSSWTLDQEDQDTPRDMPDGPEHLDNISSVHGSVLVNENVALPKTSSVIESKYEGPRSIVGSIPNEDNGSTCPANTPTPDDQL